MRIVNIAVLATALAALTGVHGVARAAQDAGSESAQQLFEAGEYERALAALQEERDAASASTENHYLASLVLLRLSPPQVDRAHAELDAVRSDEREAWQHTADSAAALAANDTTAALEAATAAVAADPMLFAAQYQLGLAHARAENWPAAAEAFERATDLDPAFAYAHYYAGIAYSRLRRADVEARHFELFIRLAPKAPERLAVESIMRTLRGR